MLAGPAAWGRATAQQLLAQVATPLWVGAAPPAGNHRGSGIALTMAQAATVLGREFDAVVFDAHAGFDPEAFGAVSGTVRGGGGLLLLTPPLARWPHLPDPDAARIAMHPLTAAHVTGHFLHRLVRIIAAEAVAVITPDSPQPPPLPPPASQTTSPDAGPCRSADQAAAVAVLLHLAQGHRHRPLVLTADRGRGKSAALGIAAAELLRAAPRRILVTAPRPEAVDPVFTHAARLLPGANTGRHRLRLGEGELTFVAPDELLRQPQPADLLLVDEAAAIPAPLLTRLLDHYPRIAFATTMHGYEGSGRGFALRFQPVLDTRTPGWRALHLATPIRWAAGDPLERFVNHALLLATRAAADGQLADAQPEGCTWERLDREALAGAETLLQELFGLLVLAHYRTSPLDLRHLLDGPGVTVHALRWRGHVAATALVAEEGGFDADLARAIYEGRRRPRGHLLAQSLAAHVGVEMGPCLHGARVLRIAVHPAVQGRGLGRRLLAEVTATASTAGLDYIGASFGATVPLLRFWQRDGFVPLHLGLGRDAASGERALLLLRPLSTAGMALADEARARFARLLPCLLADSLRELDPDLAAALLTDLPAAQVDDTTAPRRELEAFAFARRGYEVSLGALRPLVVAALRRADAPLSEQQRALLVGKVLQGQDYATVAARCGLSGKAAVVAALREAVGRLLTEATP